MTKKNADRIDLAYKFAVIVGGIVAGVTFFFTFVTQDTFDAARAEDRAECKERVTRAETAAEKTDKLILLRVGSVDRKVDGLKDLLIRWRNEK